MRKSFDISFQNEIDSDDSNLVIKQLSWTHFIGMTIDDLNRYIKWVQTHNSSEIIPVPLYDDEGSYQTVIYIYPKNINVNYSLNTSFGSFGEKEIQEFEKTQTIAIEGVSRLEAGELEYPFSDITSIEWIGDVYDLKGNAVYSLELLKYPPNPPIPYPITHGLLSDWEPSIADYWDLGKNVYGLLKITFNVYRHKYTLTAQARGVSDRDFSEVVYVRYENNITWLQLSAPPRDEFEDRLANTLEIPIEVGFSYHCDRFASEKENLWDSTLQSNSNYTPKGLLLPFYFSGNNTLTSNFSFGDNFVLTFNFDTVNSYVMSTQTEQHIVSIKMDDWFTFSFIKEVTGNGYCAYELFIENESVDFQSIEYTSNSFGVQLNIVKRNNIITFLGQSDIGFSYKYDISYLNAPNNPIILDCLFIASQPVQTLSEVLFTYFRMKEI